MPKFEANMNYILPSPPSSMKQCNKSATVKFHMELLLTTTTRKQSRSGATPYDCVHSIIANIDQSAPNLVKMYVIIRSRMISIMDLIRPELSELSALELENLPYLTLFTL